MAAQEAAAHILKPHPIHALRYITISLRIKVNSAITQLSQKNFRII